jgi:hypothetical protein
MQGARMQQGVRAVVVVGRKEWSAAGGGLVLLFWLSSVSTVDGMRMRVVVRWVRSAWAWLGVCRAASGDTTQGETRLKAQR